MEFVLGVIIVKETKVKKDQDHLRILIDKKLSLITLSN